MLLYTPLPTELVMKGADEYKPSYFQVPYKKGYIEVEAISPTRARIVRLISDDVNDYLHPGLQPGGEIKLSWQLI